MKNRMAVVMPMAIPPTVNKRLIWRSRLLEGVTDGEKDLDRVIDGVVDVEGVADCDTGDGDGTGSRTGTRRLKEWQSRRGTQ